MGRKAKESLSLNDIKTNLASSLRTNQTANVHEWVTKNRMKTEDGIPLDFTDRPYLIDIYNDKGGPDGKGGKLVLSASAQIGKSTLAYFKALAACMYDGWNVAYSLPTQEMSQLLTESKLNRIIDNNPLIRNAVKASNYSRKVVNDKMLYLVYTHGSASGIAFSSDLNIYDEHARSNQNTINQLKSRTLNSRWGYEWHISNPGVVSDDFDRLFKLSDMKHWAFKHSKCGKWQVFDFEENVHWEQEKFICKHCKQEVSDEDRVKGGQWVKKFQDRDISGYWIHQAMRLNASVKEMKFEKAKSLKDFTQMYMGLAYSASDTTVNHQLIKQHLITPMVPRRNVVMGLDVGPSYGHTAILMADGIVFKVALLKSWQEVRDMINKFNVEVCVVDNGPELSNAMDLQADYEHGRVWRAIYTRNKPEEVVKYNEDVAHINVHRSFYFDEIINHIKDGVYKFAFDEFDPQLKRLADQFSTMGCTIEPDAQGNMQIRWNSPDGAADHAAHAFLYASLAWKRLREYSKNYVPYTPSEYEIDRSNQIIDGMLEDGEEKISWLNL